jgi:hypothetical protein
MYDSKARECKIKEQQVIIKTAEDLIKENKAAIKGIEDAASTAYIVRREESAAKQFESWRTGSSMFQNCTTLIEVET